MVSKTLQTTSTLLFRAIADTNIKKNRYNKRVIVKNNKQQGTTYTGSPLIITNTNLSRDKRFIEKYLKADSIKL